MRANKITMNSVCKDTIACIAITLFATLFPSCLANAQEYPSDGFASELYPKKTIALVRCEDSAEFLHSIHKASFYKAIRETPLFGFLDDSIKLATQFEEFQFAENINNDELRLDALLDAWFGNGPLEFCVYENGDDIEFFGAVSIQPDSLPITFLFSDKGLTFMQSKLGCASVVGHPDTIFFRTKNLYVRRQGTNLVFGNRLEVVHHWDGEKREFAAGNLGRDRRFQIISRHLKFSKQPPNALVFYVKLPSIFAGSSAGTPERMLEDALRKIDVHEMLATGGVLEFPDEGDVEFQIDLFLLQAMPKSKINKLISLEPLEDGLAIDVHGNSDFYWAANLDLEFLVDGIAELNELIKIPGSGPPSSRKPLGFLTGFSPALGFLNYIPRNRLELLDGRWEMFGRVLDEEGYLEVDSASRLRGKLGAPDSLREILLEFPAAKFMTQRELNSVFWMSMNDVMYSRRKKSRLEDNEKAGIKNREYKRQVFTNFQNCLGLYSSDSLFKRHVTGDYEALSDDPDFKNVLAEATKNERPGLFAFFRGTYVFRHLFHWIRAQQFRFVYQTERDKKKMAADPESFQSQMTQKAIDRYKEWSFEEFASGLGYGGIAAFEKPNGMRLKFFLLRKSSN